MKPILKILRNFFVLLGVIFFMITLGILALISQHFENAKTKTALPAAFTLTLTLAQPMEEAIPPMLRSLAGEDAPPSVREWIAALELAAKDEKVKAVYVRAVGGGVTLTQAEELRASIKNVRAAGKPVIFFTDSFGEMDNGTAMTYLAAAVDKIIVQPGGFAGFTGIAVQQPYFRGFLDRNGLLPEFEKRRAYKSAMDNLIETNMTPESRADMIRLVEQLSNNIMQAVAKDRKIEISVLADLRDMSPLAVNAAGKLVDAVQYEDQIELPAEQITLAEYFAQMTLPSAADKVPGIALVDASGAVMRGAGQGAGPFSEKMITAENFTKMLQELQENKNISAVVIRLNSPGGSAIASESIHRAIEKLKAAGKPVIISMTDVAASGGYYMAAAGTKILALPSTLTGSIGVIVGKVSAGNLSQQYGVNWDEVSAGRNAAMFGTGRGFNEDERAAVARTADFVYETFKSRVQNARKLSPEAVEELAQGRVWTGIEAKEKGLIDQTGGLLDAIAAARTELKLAPDATVNIVPYPDQNDPLLFIQLLFKRMAVGDQVSVLGHLLAFLQPRLLQLQPLQLQY